MFGWLRRLFAPRESSPDARVDDRTDTAPTSSLDGLEIGRFAPLEHSAARRELTGIGLRVGRLWSLPWFGRRDVIPPVEDKRTLLVDRAMVGQGLITPEELAEIHAVGQQMDRLAPVFEAATATGEQAAAEATQQRLQRKAARRAESAERKRRRAAAIAERRHNDIVFLGRGVSRGLADRTADASRLTARGLPVLATPLELAEALQVTIGRLRWLAFHSDAATCTHYVTFTIPKRSGGVRRLAAPHRSLRKCQQWILDNILRHVQPHEAAHGFVPGRSIVSNARPHVQAKVVINADLTDFFPSIGFGRVAGIFKWLGYSPAVATILGLLATECPRRVVRFAGQTYYAAVGPRGLPQGACTSPALSNLVAHGLDCRLMGLAARLDWTYTRYADDVTLSQPGESPVSVGYMLARLRHIAEDEGFRLNRNKTRVLRSNTRQTVTGVVVNQRPGVPRKLVRRLRAILHRAQYEGLAHQNRSGIPHFEDWLCGMISYVAMVNPEQGRPLQEAYRNLG